MSNAKAELGEYPHVKGCFSTCPSCGEDDCLEATYRETVVYNVAEIEEDFVHLEDETAGEQEDAELLNVRCSKCDTRWYSLEDFVRAHALKAKNAAEHVSKT